jgi:MFS family permease
MFLVKKPLFIALAASLFSFYNLIVFSLMNVLSVYLIQDRGFSPQSIGFMSSFDLWGNVLGFIPIGILLDRYPIRYLACPLLSLAIISTIGMAFVENLAILCLLRFLQGLASASSLLVLMRVGTELYPNHSNKTIGLMILLALSGGIVGNSFFAFLASRLGWQCALILIGGIGLFCLFFMLIVFGNEKGIKQKFSFKFFNKINGLAGINLGLLNTPVFVLGSLFGNQYIMKQSALSLEQAAFVSSLLFFGIMIGSPLIGFLADKIGNFLLLMIGYLGLILCTVILIFSSTQLDNYFLLVFFALGFFSCTQNLIYPTIGKKALSSPSASMGIAALIANALGALLQLFFGYLIPYSTLNNPIHYYCLALVFLIGCYLLRVYHRMVG